MKKFKFFALAALFGMSINAMAQKEKSTDTFTYELDGDNNAIITGFVNGLSSAKMATATIPATIKGSGTTTYKVVAIDGTKSKSTPFQSCGKLLKLEFAENSNVTEIKAKSFDGAKNLEEVDLTNAKNLNTIGAAAFNGTAIEEIDLTPTKIKILNQLFSTSSSDNKKLSTIKLPASLTTINTKAFQKCKELAIVNFTKCSKPITIKAYVFQDCLFFNELELPACVSVISDDAFAGSRIETLTINSNSDGGKPTIGAIGGGVKTIVVKGAFQGKFGDGTNTVSETLTSLTFKGAVKKNALAKGSFVKASKLANVTFESTIEEGAVVAGAFGDGTNWAGESVYENPWGGNYVGLNVTYAPEESTKASEKAFDVKAFWDTDIWTTWKVTFNTSTWYAGKITTSDKPNIYGIRVLAAAVTKNIEVANNGEGKYYYATFREAGKYKIAAEQNGGKVMVYSAYFDETKNGNNWSNQVYMEQLTLFGGCYYVPANTAVIIKSTTEDDVVAELTTSDANSTHLVYDKNLAYYIQSNGIKVTATEMYGIELKEDLGAGNIPYVLKPIDEYNFEWTKVADKRILPKGTFYLVANNNTTEYDRLNVVWTDGSEEEATAIKTVKKANAENGAIFNLSGQKVSAAYKGVVIKNGKKMIQK